MKPSIIHIVLGAIILAGMSACTQQEGVATEHPVAIVDSLQQIVAEEVQARVNRTEAEWGVGILMDVHSGTVVAMYDTDSTLVHAQSAWEMDGIVSPLALLAVYSIEPQGWDTAVTVCREGVTYNGYLFRDPHPRDATFSLSDAIATSSHVAVSQYMLRVFEQQPVLLPKILARWGFEFAAQDSACDAMTKTLAYAMGYHCTITPVQLAYLYSCVATGQHLRVPANGLDSIRLGLHRVVWDNHLGTASINPWTYARRKATRCRLRARRARHKSVPTGSMTDSIIGCLLWGISPRTIRSTRALLFLTTQSITAITRQVPIAAFPSATLRNGYRHTNR